MGDRDTTNNITTCTTLILVAVTLAFAVCAEEMIDEPAADLYEQQSELYDSLLQKPATKKPATTSNRAAKIKEVDAKVAELNKQYDSKKHTKVQRKAKVVHKKVHTKVQKMNTHVQKPHAKVQQYARKKQVDAKVVQLNKQYASRKHTKVHKLAKAEMSLYQQQSEMYQEMLE